MSIIHKLIDKARNSTGNHFSLTTSSSSPSSGSTLPPEDAKDSFLHRSLLKNHSAQSSTASTARGGMNTSSDKPMQSYSSTPSHNASIATANTGDKGVSTPQSQPQHQHNYYHNAQQQHYAKGPKLKLDDFQLLRTLGTGSFGRVHLAQSRHNGRHYAIKVLKKSEVVRLKQVEHTNNEKHILEAVGFPFLVNLWGTFQDDTNLYMVMDYVPGGELFSILRRKKRFPDQIAKMYAAEVVLAIEYLHSKNVVYRDLKPENLLLDRHGHIKITDFGFAKYVPDVTWTLCGTPDYLAPEVIQSKGYGKAVDWWSLGILIFEMLAGYPPFYDDDHLKLYEKILGGKIRWPAYFDPHAKDLLKRLLTPDLSRRFGNLKDGAEDIKRHRWFEGIDFAVVARCGMAMPFIPPVSHDGDASNFDVYDETTEQYGAPAPDIYRDRFPDF